jgi:endonuclease/exonuclease/phosphatase family metal-dependent hydrolase
VVVERHLPRRVEPLARTRARQQAATGRHGRLGSPEIVLNVLMRPSAAALALVAAALAATTGCMKRGLPLDRGIESTFPARAAAPSLPDRLRVVTFNVHGEPGDVIAGALRSDRALRDADLIVLEEVHRADRTGEWCSGACRLAQELGFHAVFAPGHDNGEGSDGVAIVSRAPITSAQVIELPYFDVVFNSGRRVALAATINLGDRPITVYAVHLDNRLTAGDRRTQLAPVLEHAARQRTPIIMAGDFNTSPFTWIRHVVPILTTTQDNRLEALVRQHGFSTPVADSGPTSRFLGMKLDAIYTRGFDTLRFATSNAKEISDHLALWAVMRPAPSAATAAR